MRYNNEQIIRCVLNSHRQLSRTVKWVFYFPIGSNCENEIVFKKFTASAGKAFHMIFIGFVREFSMFPERAVL